jgi:hypothetical protein
VYSDTLFTEESVKVGHFCSGVLFSNQILRQDSYVLVPLNTQEDGNRYHMVFSADLECKDVNLIKLYKKHW